MEIIVQESKRINVTSELLAEIFWEMYADDQADFFNHLGQIVDAHDWVTQIQSILNSERLDKLGRCRMEAFTLAGVPE